MKIIWQFGSPFELFWYPHGSRCFSRSCIDGIGKKYYCSLHLSNTIMNIWKTIFFLSNHLSTMFHQKKLHYLKVTTIVCLLLVLRTTDYLFLAKYRGKMFLTTMIPSLRKLITNLNWWLQHDVDGYISRQSRPTLSREHFISIIRENVDICWKTDDKLQHMKSLLASFVDMPIVHRMVELVYHALSTFGHIRAIS